MRCTYVLFTVGTVKQCPTTNGFMNRYKKKKKNWKTVIKKVLLTHRINRNILDFIRRLEKWVVILEANISFFVKYSNVYSRAVYLLLFTWSTLIILLLSYFHFAIPKLSRRLGRLNDGKTREFPYDLQRSRCLRQTSKNYVEFITFHKSVCYQKQ